MTRPTLPAALAGLTADLDQQQALCVNLLAVMSEGNFTDLLLRIKSLPLSPNVITQTVGELAALGLMVATVAWQQQGE